jgi:homoserine dehydrogenase
MTNDNHVVVLKFGSSVLSSENDLQTAVHEIYRWWREGRQVIAVVSAFGSTTDELTMRAHALCSEPETSALTSLLATGEAASSALLGLALSRAGIPAHVLDAVQAGLRTVGPKLDADLVAVDATRLFRELRRGVVVLPGFVGRDESGDTTLLGRGGSDLTALFLAHSLRAACVLVKDVDGLYTSDPNCTSKLASRFTVVNYKTAARVGGSVVQLKAIRFAEAHRLHFSVTSVGAGRSTEVGPFSDQVAASENPETPLRVALLGCGTVGGGVYNRLAALPELFDVTGVGTRNVERAINEEIPVRLISTDLEALIEKPVDVVVELIGGTTLAPDLVRQALNLGRDVVTANKALLAHRGDELTRFAAQSGTRLRYNGAVGGVVPALETVTRARKNGPLRAVSGVLNGTSNFVLDRIAAGVTLDEAVHEAQGHGFAEANPELDLNGTDAAQKLSLLARAAFDLNLPLRSIRREGIESLDANIVKQARERGEKLRLVAECSRVEDGFAASVRLRQLGADHPLSNVHGVENRLFIESESGETCSVSGRGAGRWPTTEAVVADLFDLRREPRLAESLDEREEFVA